MLGNSPCLAFLLASLASAPSSPYSRSFSTSPFSSLQSLALTPSRARAEAQLWETPYGLPSPPGFFYSLQAASIVSGVAVSAAVPATWLLRTEVGGCQHRRPDQHTKNKCGSTQSRPKPTVRPVSKPSLDCRPSRSTTRHSLSLVTPSTRHRQHRHVFRTAMRSMLPPRSARAQ